MEKREKSSRSEELAKERFNSWADNGKACEGCIFANDRAELCSCDIYVYPKCKPDSVYLEGNPCKYKRTIEEAIQRATRDNGKRAK